MPDQDLLEKICWKEGEGYRFWAVLYPDLTDIEVNPYSYIGCIPGHMNEIFIRMTVCKKRLPKKINSKLVYIALEALKNASDHGSKRGTPLIHGIFAGEKGICQGFKDEGGYFNRRDIKEIFENKRGITEFDPETPKNFRCGVMDTIYNYSDLIRVNIEQGVLYCVNFVNENDLESWP